MFNVEGNGFESFFEHLKVGLIELFGFHLVFTEVKMYCMNCGVVLAEWAFYCPGCGTPVPRQQGVVPAQVQANGSSQDQNMGIQAHQFQSDAPKVPAQEVVKKKSSFNIRTILSAIFSFLVMLLLGIACVAGSSQRNNAGPEPLPSEQNTEDEKKRRERS